MLQHINTAYLQLFTEYITVLSINDLHKYKITEIKNSKKKKKKKNDDHDKSVPENSRTEAISQPRWEDMFPKCVFFF